ncbi:MAG: amidohydrolase family protein [Shewanella sp.]|nr:amidohydrolase family protein [Shewanella sp.]
MINIRKVIPSIAVAMLTISSSANASVPIVKSNKKITALTHANIVITPGKQIKNATLLIEDNRIMAILKDNQIPDAAFSIDLSGYTIYPGFIDPFTQYAIKFDYPKSDEERPVYDINRIGGNAENSAIHSEKEWFSYIQADNKSSSNWISNGYTSVQTAKLDGIFRGRGTTVSLADNIPNNIIYQSRSHRFMALNKGSSKQDYPASLMGSLALIRQTLSDANWYQENKSKSGTAQHPNTVEFNSALEHLTLLDKQQIIFDTKNLNNQLRAARIMSDFELSPIQIGSGSEYSRIDEIKALNYQLILPLNFPQAPDVSVIDKAREVTLQQLRHWERAPSNPAELAKADIDFALTMNGIKSKDFWPRIRKAVKAGLSQEKALAALTTIPAEMSDIDEMAGKLEPGYMADFVVAKGNLFEDGEIFSVWLQGQEQVQQNRSLDDITGDYQLAIQQVPFDLQITLDKKLSATLNSGETQIDLNKLKFADNKLSFTAQLDEAGYAGVNRFTLWLDGKELSGHMEDAKGASIAVAGKKSTASHSESKEITTVDALTEHSFKGKLTHPNVGYGLEALPTAERIHIKNATVWTSEDQGVLKNTDILVADGKIKRIGQNLKTPKRYRVVDATGMHLTAGIIDEHSHIAINGGVNEGTYAVTSEVRIADVVNPDDVSIYRALAGGVTSAQLLHGSANPIGGQAQYIKMKWGSNAEQLKFDKAPSSIKFALGENVKQNHWGDNFNRRFPKSRMGVDTLFRQTFDAAQDYQRDLEDYDDLGRSNKRKQVAPRVDYRLEAVSEILNHQRDIHIHSYVASEILMFLKVADAYNFTVKAFTHVLEGYKVADELAKHGAGASTFSDWWAYKFEVYDAIPQNTCLMNQKGVVTSINSDDYAMQRRLNQEAAKSMMYCDMSAADAWKMVTINPAIQLGVSNYVGSIKEGKMADLVLWDNNPLSIYAKADKVWIEGTPYFNRKLDKKMQQDVAQERQALIQKILNSDVKARSGEKPTPLDEPQWHCDTVFHAWHQAH